MGLNNLGRAHLREHCPILRVLLAVTVARGRGGSVKEVELLMLRHEVATFQACPQL
jgi:hypothetical protein